MNTRCIYCWNVKAYCTCARERSQQQHPSGARPTVAGVTPEERDRLLDAYIERGVKELEIMVNADE